MYAFLSGLLSDKKHAPVFSCFGFWHLCYLLIAFAAITLAVICAKHKKQTERKKVIRCFINSAFALYLADFFLMPFAYGEIDIEKLPFHVCTAMCVMCFISRHSRLLGKFKLPFAVLGLVSNFVYLIYPAGLMWYQVNSFSYRVIQTLLFHAIMTGYGLLVLLFEDTQVDLKKDLLVIGTMTLWAVLGNTLYNGEAWGKVHFFNWFFVVRDPFYLLPEQTAPFVMPFLNIAVFFAVEAVIYSVYNRKKKRLG